MGKMHPACYNLPFGVIPHLLLPVVVSFVLYQSGSWLFGPVGGVLVVFAGTFALFSAARRGLFLRHDDSKVPKAMPIRVSEKRIEELMQVCDPVVDALIEKSISSGHKGRLIWQQQKTFEHLKHTEEYKQLEEELRHVPEWVDAEKIAKAAAFYRNNLTMVFMGLGVGLIESYTFAEDAKVMIPPIRREGR